MGRWQPDARGRLVEAAFALFGERGYENTTVAEIAERAGLTKRTFFRHFSDKREVLFWGSKYLEELFVTAVAEAPASASALDAVAASLAAAASMFEDMRDFSTRRRQLIVANPELQERELIKLASLSAALAEALRARGVPDPTAILTAEAGITVFKVSFDRWVDPSNEQTLGQLMDDSLSELRTALSGATARPAAV